MFWKKKALGSVTIFDEHDKEAADKFLDLGSAGLDSNDVLGHLSSAQVRHLAVQSALAGKESTQRALKIVQDVKVVGIDTADTLHMQTIQLENIEYDCDVVKSYVDESEGEWTAYVWWDVFVGCKYFDRWGLFFLVYEEKNQKNENRKKITKKKGKEKKITNGWKSDRNISLTNNCRTRLWNDFSDNWKNAAT